jgi:hypothetical protein
MRGNNKSIRQNLIENTDSREFRELQRAIANRRPRTSDQGICRLYTVPDFERLPARIKSAALSLLPD